MSFPHCEGEDGTLMIAWAGYDHLQLARAISDYYVDVQERLGGRDDPRLVPLLACLIELFPWLKQWHNEVDPEFGVPMGDYFEGFLQEESRNLGLTLDVDQGLAAAPAHSRPLTQIERVSRNERRIKTSTGERIESKRSHAKPQSRKEENRRKGEKRSSRPLRFEECH